MNVRASAAAAAFVTALAVTSQAGAADLGRRAEMPAKAPYIERVYDWTGFYIGVNGGGGWGRSSWDNAVSPTGGFDLSGGLVGGTVGFNLQNGPFVFGVEGDVDWSNIKGTTTNAVCPAGCETRNDWLGTARGRIGYAFDRLLPYVTGGAAFGNVKASIPGFSGAEDTRVGWTAGAGVEYAFTNNLSAKVEYLHVDLGKFDCGLSCGAPVGPDDVKFQSDIVRAGLNFRF